MAVSAKSAANRLAISFGYGEAAVTVSVPLLSVAVTKLIDMPVSKV
jgi:hypothetical protein